MPQVSLLEMAKRNSHPDERVIQLDVFLVIRVMPDKSVIIYQDNGVKIKTFSLTFEYIKQMYEELNKDERNL